MVQYSRPQRALFLSREAGATMVQYSRPQRSLFLSREAEVRVIQKKMSHVAFSNVGSLAPFSAALRRRKNEFTQLI